MTTPRLGHVWFRLGQLAALALMALLGLFDLYVGLIRGRESSNSVLTLLGVATAVATAIVWLPAHPQGSRRLPRAALVLAAASVVLTLVVRIADRPPGSAASWGFAETCGLLGVLFVVARRGAARWALAGVLGTGAALFVLPMRSTTGSGYVIAGLFLALCAAATSAGGTYLRLLDNGRQRAMATVRAEQRAEFARDLHDFIAHHVTGIVVQAQGARFIAEQDPQRVIMALEQIERAGAETMTSMRRMVGILRDPQAGPDAPLAPLAGVADLTPLLARFNSAPTPVARLHVDGTLEDIPVEVSTSGYRVVMEALTNVRQHASGARLVDVSLRRTPDWLLVRVTDDGAAQRVPGQRGHHGYGLVGLTERVRAVGGRFSAGPGIDGGWVVDAALPLRQGVTG
ncbi:sensor histidine kinase [Micromonospora sp. NBC_01796]|uniref:sensor histidine kinase n=1 Tax=Micromonospora sp. NBC_01796 TaxID=2975987 RepID=UPI002DD9DF1E|nr:histidine kinase [Micromonospora sp. NBC_01796]WSA83115.1 histidine kinase [Micromonospora sp. NBC_01796]